jgi:hypothetical protein
MKWVDELWRDVRFGVRSLLRPEGPGRLRADRGGRTLVDTPKPVVINWRDFALCRKRLLA